MYGIFAYRAERLGTASETLELFHAIEGAYKRN